MSIDKIELIIFDFDGVIVDSESISSAAHAQTLQMAGINLSAAEVDVQFTGLDFPTMRAKLIADFGTTKVDEYVANIDNIYKRFFEEQLTLIPHVLEFINHTRLAICVASNSTPDRLEISQKITNITQIFSQKTFSASMVKHPKPAPDLFLLAAEQMGKNIKNCLVIEDGAHGIKAANDAGIRSIGFYGGSHCKTGHAERLKAAGALHTFNDMSQLTNIIESINNGEY